MARVILLCGSMAVACGLHAQSPASGAKAAAEELEEVTVTGSRVIANGNDSPTPVTVLSTEQLLLANPGNITTAMQMLPTFVGSPTQGGQSSTNFQAVMNLRGMGGSRNLVLFDGHRLVPTTLLGAGISVGVDSNLIPTLLLKRVDIVTGGASAVYGSDAVSGVVNYVVDNSFNGVKVNVQGSRSTHGDDRAYNLGVAAGMPLFGGRGHVEFSAQHVVDPGLPDRFSRDWGRQVWSMQGSVVGSTAAAGSAANPYALYSNARFNVTTFGGLINTGVLADLQFAQNGVLSAFNHGIRTGSSGAESGGDGGYYTTYPAFGAQKQDLGLARFDYDFTDKTKFYAEVAAGTVYNHNPLANSEVRTRQVGFNNAYLAPLLNQANVRALLPASLQSGAAALGTPGAAGNFNFSRLFTPDQIPSSLNGARGRQYLYLAGLDGSWGQYRWSLGYEHSSATLTNTNPYNISNPRLFAAMNAVTVTAANVGSSGLAIGSIACNAALSNSAYSGCVPINLFGPTATNQAAYDYIRQYTWYRVKNGLDDFTATVSGAPISSWAGPINMALSTDLRRQTYGIDSNAQSTDPFSCTGIQFNCAATISPYVGAVTNVFPTVDVTVKELAYEAQVPLLKDRFLAKSLELNSAVRYTDYSTSGVVWSWKLGLTWALNDSLNVRATRSRDIRAPNLRDLFSPASCGNISFTDNHTNNTPGTVSSCTQGNASLKPERADTYTVGFVWTPHFIDGLSMSFDGYHINVRDSLTNVSVTQPASQQACELSGGTSPICALYVRPAGCDFSNRSPSCYPTRVNNVTLNSGGILSFGIDSEINYSRSIAARPFSARLLTTYQPTYTTDQGPAGIIYGGGTADSLAGLLNLPNVKSMLQLNYEVARNLTATLQERYRNALKQHGSPVLFFTLGKMPPNWYTDVTLDYKLAPGTAAMNIFFNVRNLFNKQPDHYAASGANAQIGSLGGYIPGDDIVGRYFTLGVRYKL
jgi:outer membrane receptor protein involved in Fe transport